MAVFKDGNICSNDCTGCQANRFMNEYIWVVALMAELEYSDQVIIDLGVLLPKELRALGAARMV